MARLVDVTPGHADIGTSGRRIPAMFRLLGKILSRTRQTAESRAYIRKRKAQAKRLIGLKKSRDGN